MHIHLRPLRAEDASLMLEWMQDSAIACFFRFDAMNMTEEKCRAFIESANREPGSLHYAIADERDEYLGTVSLKDISDGRAEYAISTRRCAHGTGAAMQATKEILRIAFDELGLESVFLNVLEENLRANAFYRKAGFHYMHTEKNALELRGQKKALNWYEVNKEQRHE
jgi:diamine N-acetyltransferase